MQAKDEIRQVSSSGGMFTILADYIFERGGFVCGAAFNKNENWKVEHIIIDKKEDLYKLRGSKYVQSDKKDIFKQIKELLNKDKYVLFSGCPCEVAGLKNFLRKDYDKLILVDLLCGSVESPKIWEKYLKENFFDKKVKEIKFRDKNSFGWALQFNVYFVNGNSYREVAWKNEYCRFYESKIMSRKSCYKCSFSSLPRVGEITIGDFWGIDKYNSEIYDSKGTSLIFVNNDKGKNVIDNINKESISILNEMELNIIGFHPNTAGFFNRRNWNINDKREVFLKKLKLFDFNKVVHHFLEGKADVGLVGFNGSANYGSILNTYSVYNNLEKLGYNTMLISYIPYFVNAKHFYNKKFHKKYFSKTKPYRYKYEMYELNNDIDIFVAGSDQIFRYNAENWDHRGRKYFNIFYSSFVSYNKQLISFASSFGHSTYSGDYYNRIYTNYCLQKFDHISVREKDAIGLMKRLFNIENVEQVIEPVFILDYEELDKIIADSSLTHKGKLAYYFLDPTK